MTSDKVYKTWPGYEIYQAVYNKSSLFDTSPLHQTLEEVMGQFEHKIYRKVMVGATDIETGEELVYDFDNLKEDELVTSIVSSASVPVVFPFTKL